jgi:hypothetical protein
MCFLCSRRSTDRTQDSGSCNTGSNPVESTKKRSKNICETKMIKENRIMVRLIALWVIFILSLMLIIWAVQPFAASIMNSDSMQGDMMGYGGGYYAPYSSLASCILPPAYPGSQGMFPGTEPDKATLEQYNKDYQKYTQDYQEACAQDVLRQQMSQGNYISMGFSRWWITIFLAAMSAIISLMLIKKTERE